MESASVGIWAGTGGRHEPERINGAAHFLEHLLFKGTARRSASAITREIEGVGGDLNAFTSEDHTCYYAKVEARRMPRVADVLSDMYRHSTLPAEEVERERDVIREEILMGRDTPSQVVEELLAATFWPGHPLGRPLTGTAASISRIDRTVLVDFWRRAYCARNTVFAVAGAVEHDAVLREASPLLETLNGGRPPTSVQVPRPRSRRSLRVAFDLRDDEQVQLALGFPGPGRGEPGRFAARVLSAILGENMSSRLFQLLRERHGLCYSVSSQVDALHETALFSIYLGLEMGKVERSVRLIGRELRRLANHAPSRAELGRAKEYLVAQHRIGMEGTTSQMMWLGECLLGFGRVVDPAAAREALAAVTAAEVQAMARSCFFGAGATVLTAVGPVEQTEAALGKAFRNAAS